MLKLNRYVSCRSIRQILLPSISAIAHSRNCIFTFYSFCNPDTCWFDFRENKLFGVTSTCKFAIGHGHNFTYCFFVCISDRFNFQISQGNNNNDDDNNNNLRLFDC